MILRKLYTTTLEHIICGDININYLNDGKKKSQLEALIHTHNLTRTANFPTRIEKNSTTGTDIFTDIARRDSHSICPIIKELSDHDSQLITFNTITFKFPTKQVMEIRKINKYTINNSLTKLSYETWDITYYSDDVNKMFNACLDTYLKIFYSTFPLKKNSNCYQKK
jgi:hypothetical protein